MVSSLTSDVVSAVTSDMVSAVTSDVVSAVTSDMVSACQAARTVHSYSVTADYTAHTPHTQI